MFENCNTLAELTAERIRLAATEDIVAVNNAYNARRIDILQSKSNFTRVEFTKLAEYPPQDKVCGIPIAGNSPKPATITLTESGFLF